MSHKFFTNTVVGNMIKSIVEDANLPIFPTISDGDYIIGGYYYIHRRDILYCRKSGYYNSGDENEARVVEYSNDFLFGKEYSYTRKHPSRCGYYDSTAHRFLGEYLRCVRDIYNVDVMSMYNCFTYESTKDFHLSTKYKTTDNVTVVTVEAVDGEDTSVKTLLVPVKFNKTYTIAIDSVSPVLIKPVLYNGMKGFSISEDPKRDPVKAIEYLEKVGEGNVGTVIGNMSFTQPIKYAVSNKGAGDADNFAYRFEKYLYLCIQLDVSNTSSIVVLEGDYTQKASVSVSGVGDRMKLIGNISLLQMNDRTFRAFSDKLVEYLLLSVVTSDEEIWKNIETYQKYAKDIWSDEEGLKWLKDIEPGVWSDSIRLLIYNKYMQNGDSRYPKIDINGYIDSDVERFLIDKHTKVVTQGG